MTDLRKAAERIVEAAEKIDGSDELDNAIKALFQALEQQEQEPVGQLQEDSYGRGQVLWFNKPPDKTMLYTAPPKREWVGLTDEEFKHFSFYAPWEIVQEVESKLKEKNT